MKTSYYLVVFLCYIAHCYGVYAQINTETISFNIFIEPVEAISKTDTTIIFDYRSEDIQQLSITGEPDIAGKVYNVPLPADVDPESIECMLEHEEYRKIENPDHLEIEPVPPIMTWIDGKPVEEWPANKQIVNGKDVSVYFSNEFWPVENIRLLSINNVRTSLYIKVAVPVIYYRPVTGEIKQLTKASIVINYSKKVKQLRAAGEEILDPIGRKWINRICGSTMQLIGDDAAEPALKSMSLGEANGYYIITTNVIKNNLSRLNEFIAHKQGLGFRTEVITENDFGGGTGDVAAENIRSWLQAHYLSDQIEYVLLIGNPDPAIGNIPMKMLYPRNYAGDNKDAPSDFYYADLTGNWDLDMDGYCGEANQDFGVGGVDVAPDVLVGRIPDYGNALATDSILEKTMNYDNYFFKTWWLKNALLPMDPSDDNTPGYHLGEAIKNDILIPNNWTCHRIYDETYNLDPPPETVPTTLARVLDVWTNNSFGLTIWNTHGGPTTASDIMDITNAACLDDHYPAFTFQSSCSNAHPETENNLSYTLLKNGGINTIGATRYSWYYPGETVYKGRPSNNGMAYEYALNIVSDELSAGEALYALKEYLPNTLWVNKTVFNIYGDPSLMINGCDNPPKINVEDVSVPYGDPVPPFSVIGENIRWYDDVYMTNIVNVGEIFSTGHINPGIYTYYVTQTVDGCESEPAEISLIILLMPPVADDVIITAGEEPILKAKGTNIRWYHVLDTLYDSRDGQVYELVQMGDQLWMAENMNYYTDYGSWYYDDDSTAYADVYGRLYNYEMAQNVCPDDFHLPADDEWKDLERFIGMNEAELDKSRDRGWDEGGKLKESGTEHWKYPNNSATDEYGFRVLPGGIRWSSGNFAFSTEWAIFWVIPELTRVFYYNNSMIERVGYCGGSGANGMSVRCMKDNAQFISGNEINTGYYEIGEYTFLVTQTVNGEESVADTVTLTILPAPPEVDDINICKGEEVPEFRAEGESIRWYSAANNPLYDAREQRYYNIVYIGNQVWMQENLDYYTPTGSAYYDNDSLQYASEYGRLYEWETAMTACPEEYHLPSNEDWEELADYLGGRSEAGGKMKEQGETHWYPPNTGATNESGFNAFGAGQKLRDTDAFSSLKLHTLFWSSDTSTRYQNSSYCWSLDYVTTLLDKLYLNRKYGFSVRCMRNHHEPVCIENEYTPSYEDTGEYTYYVTQTVDGFESFPDTVLLTIYPIPTKPDAVDITMCEGEEMPELTANGTNLRWYNDDGLSELVFTGNNFTPDDTLPGTYEYFVTQSIHGCESPADTAALTIHPIPPVPLANDVTLCEGEDIPDLEAEGENIGWYSDSGTENFLHSGSTYATGQTQPGIYSYYVTQTILGCESFANHVVLTINPIPEVPSTESITLCEGEEVPDMQANGENIRWYDDEGCTNLLHSGSNYATGEWQPGSYTYYATQTILGCESPADTVILSINPIPGSPLVNDVSGCDGEEPPAFQARGENIRWYSDESLTDLLHKGNSFSTGLSQTGSYCYYVTQTVSGCESPAYNPVLLIYRIPKAPKADDIKICEGEEVPDIQAKGDYVRWFSDAALTNLLYSGEKYATGETRPGEYSYYITQTEMGCVSPSDTVKLTINPIPQSPDVDNITVCEGVRVPDFQAAGQNIRWYQDAEGTILLHLGSNYSSDETQPGVYSFYANQTILDCESPVDTAVLTIHPIPEAPVAEDIIVCEGDIIPLMEATGEDVRWYLDPEQSILLHIGSSYTPEERVPGIYFYYANQTIFGCESPVETVALTIHPKPEAPVSEDIIVCEGDVIPSMEATGEDIRWYLDPEQSILLHIGSSYTSEEKNPGTYSYYTSQTVLGCESPPDSSVLTIHPLPDAPIADDVQVCEGEDIPDLEAMGENIHWYSGAGLIDLLYQGNSFNAGKIKAGTYKYFITQTQMECEGPSDSVKLQIHPLPYIDLGHDTTINSNQGITLDAGNNYYSYGWSDGSDSPFIEISGEAIGTGDHEYWVEVTDNNSCTHADSIWIRVVKPSDTEFTSIMKSIKIYPNPARSVLYIEFEDTESQEIIFKIIDNVGRAVWVKSVYTIAGNNKIQLDIPALPESYYILRMFGKDISWSTGFIVD